MNDIVEIMPAMDTLPAWAQEAMLEGRLVRTMLEQYETAKAAGLMLGEINMAMVAKGKTQEAMLERAEYLRIVMLAWLGEWRDSMPPRAVEQLQLLSDKMKALEIDPDA